MNAKSKTTEKYSSSARRKSKHVESSESKSVEDSDGNTNKNPDMVNHQMLKIEDMFSMMVKGFKRMKNMKFIKACNFSRKTSDNAKAERFKKNDEREKKSGKFDKAKEKCYNCDGMGNFVTECRKVKSGKSNALMCKKKVWMDSSDSNEEDQLCSHGQCGS